MILTTSQLRNAWDPPCIGPHPTVALNGRGKVSVRPSIIEAVKALDACLVAHHYVTRAADTGAYVCRKITGGTGKSLHAYGIALDINWSTNPYGPRLHTDMPPAMVAAIKAIRTMKGRQVWGWGGDYRGNKDAMHYEVVCTPQDLAAGIDPATLPGRKPVVPVAPEFPTFPGNMGPSQGNVPSIKVLQTVLRDLGSYRGKIDGHWNDAVTAGVTHEKRLHDEFLLHHGTTDLTQMFGTYRAGKGMWDPIVGSKTWLWFQLRNALRAG